MHRTESSAGVATGVERRRDGGSTSRRAWRPNPAQANPAAPLPHCFSVIQSDRFSRGVGQPMFVSLRGARTSLRRDTVELVGMIEQVRKARGRLRGYRFTHRRRSANSSPPQIGRSSEYWGQTARRPTRPVLFPARQSFAGNPRARGLGVGGTAWLHDDRDM